MKRKSVLFGTSLGILATALSLAVAPASANLIFDPAFNTPGTGLGAVQTLATVQDGSGPPGSIQNNGTESGCVTYNPADPANPTFTCFAGLEGGDNQAINNTYTLSDVTGLTSAGQLGVVVNINERGLPVDGQAVLTDLYLRLFEIDGGAPLATFSYAGLDLTLTETGGIGNSGFFLFTLDTVQAAEANAVCPIIADCVVGGGVQFLAGSTSGGPETIYVKTAGDGGGGGEIPEPASLALLGLGLVGLAIGRRRKH